jgi:hypothetical protein
MARYSLKEGAYQVLRVERRPMSIDEIHAKAKLNALVDGQRNAMYQTVMADLRLGDTRFMRIDKAFGLREWISDPDPELSRTARRAAIEERLQQWLNRVDYVLDNPSRAPAADVLCAWVILCYKLELHHEADRLFHLIHRDAADEWLYNWARKVQKVSQAKSRAT